MMFLLENVINVPTNLKKKKKDELALRYGYFLGDLSTISKKTS